MRTEEPGSNIVFFPITIGPNLEAVYQRRRQLEYYRKDIKSVKYMQHYSKCIFKQNSNCVSPGSGCNTRV